MRSPTGRTPKDHYNVLRFSLQKPFLCGICLLVLSLGSCNERPVDQPSRSSSRQEQHQSATPTRPVETNGAQDERSERLTVPLQALQQAAFQTTVVERRPFRDEMRVTATIKPNEYRLTHVSPQIEGRVLDVLVQLGDHVRAGQPLALFDSIVLGQNKSAFLQAKTDRHVDERNYIRVKGLFDQRISSEKEYLEAKGQYEKSLATYQAAYEALRLIGLSNQDINTITWSEKGKPLSFFPLLAPQAGTVIERPITRGELVTPKDNAFTVVDLSTVWILLDIYEQHLAAISVGSMVTIAVDAYPGETFRGQIVYLGYVVNPDTRTVDARVEIANPDRRLRPGMFARATLTLPSTNEDHQVMVVPQDAIQQVEDQPTAFVEEQPGSYLVRSVVVGRRSGHDVEIRSGLSEGERVVTRGAFELKSIVLKGRIAHD